MLSANFKPKRTAAASHGLPATARLSCLIIDEINYLTYSNLTRDTQKSLREVRLRLNFTGL